MDEKRKYRRRSLLYNLPVVDHETGEAMGHVANVSPDGLMLITGNRLDKGSVVHIRVALPEKIFGLDHIECKAQCMWCKPNQATETFDVGLQMREIEQRNIEAIVALITKYRILD